MVATPKIHYQLDGTTLTGSLEDKTHYVEPADESVEVEKSTSYPEIELPLPIDTQNRDHSDPSPQSTVCIVRTT